MKRKLGITLLFLCLSISTWARITASCSWGYGAQLYKAQAFSYTPNRVGYRVSEYAYGFTYLSTAYLNFALSYEFAHKASIGLKSGYKGIDQNYSIIPLELEARYYFKSYEESSAFLSLEAGSALHDLNFKDQIILASLGLGYREHLYKSLSVDFFLKLDAFYGHPLPIDRYEGEIPRSQLYFSYVSCAFLNLGIQINF